jgi:hypothetical protein
MTRLNWAQRAARTDKVLARFRARAFDWNGASCIHLARAQAVAMGHRVPSLGRIRSALDARAALKAQGCDRIDELLDGLFPRVAPLGMWVGDLCILRGDGAEDPALPAICIGDGQGNLFGWHDVDPSRLWAIKFAMADVAGAWRL